MQHQQQKQNEFMQTRDQLRDGGPKSSSPGTWPSFRPVDFLPLDEDSQHSDIITVSHSITGSSRPLHINDTHGFVSSSLKPPNVLVADIR